MAMHAAKSLKGANNFTRITMLMPMMIFLIIISVFPGVYLLWISFTDLQVNNMAEEKFVGISNYIQIFTGESLFPSALAKTMIFCVAALPIQFILGYIIAKIFMSATLLKVKGIGILRTIYLFPLMITPLSVGLFWNYLLNPGVGAVNFLFHSLHLPLQEWLSNSVTAFPCIIGIYLWQWTPYTAMLILAGLLSIGPEIYESADVDGAGLLRKVISIDLPLVKKVIGIAVILSLVQIVQTFELILATTNGGPGTSTIVSGYAIYRESFKYFSNGKAAAMSIVIVVISTIISQLFAKIMLKEDE
ncbi:MAG: sugar ABC transporter permease [Anaerocolumna sp.]